MDEERTGGHSLPGEDESDRSQRQLEELLVEVRVAMPGVQVLFAFLLVVPFQARFGEVTSTERGLYIVTMIASGIATACFIAPSALHRVLFRRGQREFIISMGNRFVLAGLAGLAIAMSCAAALVISFLSTPLAGWITLTCAALLFSSLWFGLPLERLRHADED